MLWTFPLATQGSTHIPGGAPGDNVAFLWNFWWMRAALADSSPFLRTGLLFAPVGADLTLHTHTVLPAFVGATVLGWLPVVTALNVSIVVALALNGFCAYLLAWRITGDRGASVVAGVIFGGSPFVSAHLTGHFNLTSAWTLPLFALAITEALKRGSRRWAAAAGAIVGATAYIDYTFVVFQLVFAIGSAAYGSRRWSVSRGAPSRRRRILARLTAGGVLAVAALLAGIAATGGFAFAVGPIRISARTAFNPLQIMWVLVALWLWLRLNPRVTASPSGDPDHDGALRTLAVAAAVFFCAAAPIMWRAGALILRDEYVTQHYLWRSAPRGVDIATLFLGNPWHGIWGGGVRGLYGWIGIDPVEGVAWLGIAPVILAAFAIRRHWPRPAVRLWTAIGAAFAVWALGPHLMAFGTNTGMILPQTLVRYVPIVSNARIPGRAMVMVYLALGVLAAIGLAGARGRTRRGLTLVAAAGLAVVADYCPAPFPLTGLSHPAIYDVLRTRTEPGAVLELPLGIRDGFGHRGRFDDWVLFYQTVHGRPIAGGFAARVSPVVFARYEADPLLSALLRASAGAAVDPFPDRAAATERLAANGIAFVILNRATAPPALIQYVDEVLPLSVVHHGDGRTLYVVSK